MQLTSNEHSVEKRIEAIIESLNQNGQAFWAQILSFMEKSHNVVASRIAGLITLANKDLSILHTNLETLFLVAIESKISKHARSKTENSMIFDAESHAGLLERALPYYLPYLEQKGQNNIMKGVDTVLKEFEYKVVEKIDLFTNNPGVGEKACQDFSNRREVKDQLGKYHTVLRLLLDKSNVTRYESLFHLGSSAAFVIQSKSYSFRLLLAIYYLAATDPKMQFSLKWIEMNIDQLIDSTLPGELQKIKNDEEKVSKFYEDLRSSLKSEDRRKLLEKSLDYFINILAEDMRRAHNGDPGFPSEEDKLDAPACIPGTINKLLASCISNDLMYVPVPNSRRIIELIDEYIISTLEAAENTNLRKALYDFLDYSLMGADPSFDSIMLYSQYILELSGEKNIQEIYRYLKNSSVKLDIKNLTIEVQKDIESCISGIIQHKQGEFLFLPEFGRTGFFAAKLISIGAKTKAKQDLYTGLYNKVVPIINEVRILSYSLDIIKQLAKNELTKMLLSLKYKESKEIYQRINSFTPLFNEYLAKKGELTDKFRLLFNEAVKGLEENYKKNYEQKLFENLQKASREITKDFEAELSKVTFYVEDFKNILRQIIELDNLKEPNEHGVTWSNAIYDLAQRSLDTKFVEDIQALESLIHLMLVELDAKGCQYQLNILENKIITNNSHKIKNCLQDIFLKQKHFSEQPLQFFDASTYKSQIMKTVTLEEVVNRASTIFKNELTKMDEFARTQLYRIEATKDVRGKLSIWNENDNSSTANSYKQWKQVIINLLQTRTSSSLQGIYYFILLTFYHNLRIDETFKINIETLEEIIEFFLAEKPANTPTQIYLKDVSNCIYKSKQQDVSDEECVNSLAGYLSCLLTRLKFLTNGIKSGAIVITSHQVATNLLLADQEPYINAVKAYYLKAGKDESIIQKLDYSKKRIVLRTALSSPNSLAITYFNFNNQDKISKAICNTPNTRVVSIKIENHNCEFILSDEMLIFEEINRKMELCCDEEYGEVSYLVPCGLPISAFMSQAFQFEMRQGTSMGYIKMQKSLEVKHLFKQNGYYLRGEESLIEESDKRKMAISKVSGDLKKIKLDQDAKIADKNSFFATAVQEEYGNSSKDEEMESEEKPYKLNS